MEKTKRETDRFTNKDKVCPHCGSNIEGHCYGTRVIYWCDVCGANNRKYKPSISIELS